MPPGGGLMFPAGGMMPMEMRQPPLGRMSPGPRDRTRSYDSRSPSPQYHHSPTSRSERRPSPPSARHRGPSPARSERFYRERRERERYYSRDRSLSPDREDS